MNTLRTSPDVLMRATTAYVRNLLQFQRAILAYTEDFYRLFFQTASTIAKNQDQHAPDYTDPSIAHSISELISLISELNMSAFRESVSYWNERSQELFAATLRWDIEEIERFWSRQAEALDIVLHRFPIAEKDIRPRMGFRFDDARRFRETAETSRAILYQVLPLAEGIVPRLNGKPIVHFAPFTLPENILDLLPDEGISMVGAFANSGTPTYFIHIRDILETPAVQTMNEEELLEDIRYFCELLRDRHGRKVTLSGTCQGALPTLHAVCAEFLGIHHAVDAWLGIAPAYSLAASHRVRKQIGRVPRSHRKLALITERLPNGNRVVIGEPSALSSRLWNFDTENPFARLFTDLRDAEKGDLSPFALALRSYLSSIRPMPLAITEASQRCSMIPIDEEGTLPETLFGSPATLRTPIEHGIRLHVVAGSKDTVVDPDAALAMFQIACVKNYERATYQVVDGAGHVALMTTCTHPNSKNFIGNPGGPLWFHLELERTPSE